MIVLLWWTSCQSVQDFSSQCFFEPCRPQAPPIVVCDVMAQDCPDGQRCTIDYVLAPPGGRWVEMCAPAPEQTAAYGEPCDDWAYADHDCPIGGMCLDDVCVGVCLTDLDCEDAGLAASCLRVFGTEYGYCAFDCDPLLPPARGDCPPEQSCMRVFAEFSCVEEYSDVPVGGRCIYATDCGPGVSCVVDTCRTHCDTRNGNADCPGSLECTPFEVNPAGLEHVGFCREAS